MPRPRKCRKVCNLPQYREFIPRNGQSNCTKIMMTIDEYETIRLIDYENLSQEECSQQMNVARTTVQQIYANARRKLADTLVNGLPLIIEGGDYQVCDGNTTSCGCGRCCPKQKLNQNYPLTKEEKKQ